MHNKNPIYKLDLFHGIQEKKCAYFYLHPHHKNIGNNILLIILFIYLFLILTASINVGKLQVPLLIYYI